MGKEKAANPLKIKKTEVLTDVTKVKSSMKKILKSTKNPVIAMSAMNSLIYVGAIELQIMEDKPREVVIPTLPPAPIVTDKLINLEDTNAEWANEW